MSKDNEYNKANDAENVINRNQFLAKKHPTDNQADNPYKDEFDILKTDTTFDSLEFPLDIFPENISKIIEQLNKKMNFQPQTTAAGILFTVSTVIGSSRVLHVKNGWEANACLWLNIVGETGTTKSHPINWTLKPLQELETDFYSTHKVEAKKYALSNSKKNKENNADAPTRERRYVTNATTEGLVRTLEENPTGIGCHIDELKGLFESFNQYKGGNGNDQEFYLQAFDGGIYNTLRAKADEHFVRRMYVPLIGSIQPPVLRNIIDKSNNNGMVQRWLYIENKKITDVFTFDEVSPMDVATYTGFIKQLYVNSKRDRTNNIDAYRQTVVTLSNDSKKEFSIKMNSLRKMKEKENTSPLMFAYLSKIETYYPRFINIVSAMNDENKMVEVNTIHKTNLLVDYFIRSANIVFTNMAMQQVINQLFADKKANHKTEKVKLLCDTFGNMSVKDIASYAGCSKSHIYEYKKKS